MSETPNAYPLSWPIGRKRTIGRRNSLFKVDKRYISVDQARRRLRDELDRIDAKDIVLSSNLKLRVDGSVGSDQRTVYDPGVALYFKWKSRNVVLACDSYADVSGNIAALAAHIEATRAIERYGVGTLEQMFTGFTALPPSITINDWRAALGEPKNLEEAEATYRDRARLAHPDVGGSEARMSALNAAIAEARRFWSQP